MKNCPACCGPDCRCDCCSSFWRSNKSARLTDKDIIVLADFTNMTGDSVFDGTLRQGLSVQLERLPS